MKPLIEVEDKEPDVRFSISLRPDVAQDLKLYSEYAAGSSSNHVIAASLKRLFREDKGFKEFKASHPNAGLATPELNGSQKGK